MSFQVYQMASTVVLLAAALALYCWPLPRRTGFGLRVASVTVAVLLASALAVRNGFSLYPALTNDLSFVNAIVSFVLMLAAVTAVALVLWDAPPATALFCSSSAYLLQNLVFGVDRIVHLSGIVPFDTELLAATGLTPVSDLITLPLATATLFGLFYLLLARRLTQQGLLAVRNPLMLFAVVLAMAVSIVFDLILKDLGALEVPRRYPIVLSLIYFAICAFILVAEFEIIYRRALEESVATMEHMLAEQERLYETSSQTVAAINRRVHDMRHQVFRILRDGGEEQLDQEHLRQIAREINIYDASVKTGNAALDVTLTEKGLLCEQAGVTLTCVADGHALDFMANADLYALFGMAVDGAIAAAHDARDNVGCDDADGRSVISLDVRERMGMAAISISQALPTATADGPGRGAGQERLDAMALIVNRYGGTLVPTLDADTFHLDILIPIP